MTNSSQSCAREVADNIINGSYVFLTLVCMFYVYTVWKTRNIKEAKDRIKDHRVLLCVVVLISLIGFQFVMSDLMAYFPGVIDYFCAQ